MRSLKRNFLNHSPTDFAQIFRKHVKLMLTRYSKFHVASLARLKDIGEKRKWAASAPPPPRTARINSTARADPRGGGANGAMAPPLTQKGRANVYFGPTFHPCSLSETPHLFMIFSLLSTPRPDISIFVQIWQWPCWTTLQIPCWKSNRKTVPWINVWLNISCAEGLMLSAF